MSEIDVLEAEGMRLSNFEKVQSRSGDFTIIPNQIMRDKNISMKAKGILVTLLSLPPNWRFSEKGLSIASGEGLKSLRTGLQELEKAKYLYRYQAREERGFGQMVYVVFEQPTEVVDDKKIPLSQKGISEAPVLPFWDNTKCDNTFRAQLNNISIKENKELNVLDDDDMYARELAEIENEFKKYYSKKITPIIRKTLKELLELANKDLLLYSIGKLQDVDKPIAYLKAIIKNYLQNDIQTVAQAKVFDDKYKGKSKRKSKGKIDTIVPSSDVTVPSHFYYDWMNDLEEEKEKDYQSQTQNL